jgi:photosystem II stability/assembly factor-like uncharacterized protein
MRRVRPLARRRRRHRTVALLVAVAPALVVWMVSVDPGQTSASNQQNSVGSSLRSSSSSAHGIAKTVLGGQSLLQIWPVDDTTLWAFSQNLGGGVQGIELTNDGGASWTNVTPPGLAVTGGANWINATFALSATKAWVAYGGVEKNPQTLLYTGDAGRRWTKVGVLPNYGCVPQFVTRSQGTCTAYEGALGSMTIVIYRTANGGASWRRIFDDHAEGLSGRSAPGSLPFGCDKRVEFTSVTRGWALFWCNGGFASIYETTDGGVTWIDRPATPPSTPLPSGSVFTGTPVLRGARGAVAFAGGENSIVYVTRDAGRSFTPVYPPGKVRSWYVDVVTPLIWRLACQDTILGTDDGGKSWFTVADDATRPIAGERYAPSSPDIVFANHRQGWLTWSSGNGDLLMRTTNGGRNWKTVEVPGT